MNISVNSQLLAKELRALNKIAPTKPAIPILSHVLLTATDTLSLAATDLELAYRTTCVAQITTPGTVALPVAKILAMVEQFPDADVNILLDGKHAVIKCGAFKSRMQAMSPEDFPQLQEPNGVSSTLDGTSFRQMITRTRYAVAADASRYLLQGALLALAGPVAAMCATDSKRLALATMTRQGAEARVVIPVKALDVLANGADLEIELTVSERHLFFGSDNRLLISRTIDGEFPKYERILPRENSNVVTVERSILASALRRVGLVSEQNQSTLFDFAEGRLDISTSSAEIGDADERVPIGYVGEPLTMQCSWRLLLDALDAASGQTVTLALKDASSPILFTDGDDSLAVIMPMRL